MDLKKKYAVATRPETPPYDGAIDEYERGMSASRLTELFSEIVGPLKQLTKQIIAAKENLPNIHEALKGGDLWTVEKQTDLCKEVAKVLGLTIIEAGLVRQKFTPFADADWDEELTGDCGLVFLSKDVSVHPFTGGAGPDDTRITTRYSTSDPFEGIMGTIHELDTHCMNRAGTKSLLDFQYRTRCRLEYMNRKVFSGSG